MDPGLVGLSVKDESILGDPNLITFVVYVDSVGVVNFLKLAGDDHEAVVLLIVQLS